MAGVLIAIGSAFENVRVDALFVWRGYERLHGGLGMSAVVVGVEPRFNRILSAVPVAHPGFGLAP